MNERKTTNILLLVLVIPVVFYLLKILSFIFIPLVFSMFIALLFVPTMRWLGKKKVPKVISLIIVILIIAGFFKIGGILITLSSKEIMAAASNGVFFEIAETKLINLVILIESFFGIERVSEGNVLLHYFQKSNISDSFGSYINVIGDALSMTLMTMFFVVLWLAESMNFQKILNTTILKDRIASIKVFMKIEKEIIKFIKVKFVISLFTGVGFSLACVFFDVSFPIFWGLFAFAINFVQMIGSIISVILLSLFAFVELDPTGTLLFFIISITAVQVLFGGILEPIFMGKSFSINVITILVMLMFWGYIWGVPGFIMSIPITVFLKIILEQFSSTKVVADLLSGSCKESRFGIKKK